MTGMDASRRDQDVAQWRVRLTWLFSVVAVLGLCVAVNRLGGIGAATAQPPAAKPASNPFPFKTSTSSPNSTAPNSKGAGVQALPVSSSSAGGSHTPPANTSELKVLAVVNAEQITRQDLARESLRRYGKEVLENMVNKHLILQACKQYNIAITEKDVDDEITRIAKKFGLATDLWMQLLEQERNIKPAEYRRDIIWPTLALRSLAAGKIEVTQAELREAFESEYGPKVKCRLISLGTQAKAAEVHARAQSNPELFESLAKDYSDDPSAAVMGIIPPIRKHLGDPQLEQVAFRLRKGEVSPVVKVANKYILLKCEEQLPESLLSGEGLRKAQEHLRDRIRDQKLRTASADLFKQLQDQAKLLIVLNNKELEKQHPGVAAFVNGQPMAINVIAEECIARHGLVVLDGEINRKLLQQELRRRNRAVSDQDILEEVSRAAEAYGYLKPDGSPDVERWLQQVKDSDGVTQDLYVEDAVWPSAALKKLVGSNVQITEEDLKKGFDSNYGERVEVLAIVVGNQRQAQQVWEQARNNPTDLFFGELAAQYSMEPASRANHGKVPPIRRHSGQTLVEDHAFKLKAGELSPIIGVGDKFIILRCLGRTTPVVEELTAEVRRELQLDLQEKKIRLAMTQEFDRLKDTSQIDNFLAGTSQAGRRASPAGSTGVANSSTKSNAPVANRPLGPATSTATAPRPTTSLRQ